MEFPETFDEFARIYGFMDIEEHYTNGSDLIPVFRVKQWLEHEHRHGQWIDTGSGQECSECGEIQYGYDSFRYYCPNCGAKMESEGKE